MKITEAVKQLANSRSNASEFIRFCVVGIVCAAIDMVVFSICTLFIRYQYSAIAGFIVSYLVNYALTTAWTFKRPPTSANFISMLCAHLFNLFVVRVGILTLFVEVAGIDSRMAYIPTLALCAVTSFILVRFCVKR